jgi:hypothetical protein
MSVFAVLLRGENFVLDSNGKPTRYGFYTTRFVRAKTPDIAEMKSVELIRNDKLLKKSLSRKDSETPMIYAESVERRPWWHIFKHNRGYTFWDMDAKVDEVLSDE